MLSYCRFLIAFCVLPLAVFGQKGSFFGETADGRRTELFTLRNEAGMEVDITNYGGRIVSLRVPDQQQKTTDVVAGYTDLKGYLNSNEIYYGAIIGRYANRIAGGKFTLDKKTHTLAQNNGPNSLHSGPKGFHNQVWEAVQVDARTLILEYLSKDGEEGFPGNLRVRVTYALEQSVNELRIQYDAITDQPTVVNLTNHAFFNLSGEGTESIGDHLLRIESDRFSPVDRDLIPQGSAPVASSVFDFRSLKPIGANLNMPDAQLTFGKGYDHNFILRDYRPGQLARAAMVFSPKTGIAMEVSTTEPGLQFYGGNFLTGQDRGKSGKPYNFRSLFCLEPQHFPNAPNDQQQPSTNLRPGDKYLQISTYRFSSDARYAAPTAAVAVKPVPAQPTVWTAADAHAWYNKQPWRVGANFVPAYAINQLEMFQDETLDTVAIERELALAKGIGMNTMRIFLHDLLWRKDAAAFKKKIDMVLRICARQGIAPMLVFFDSVWNGEAKLGKQQEPTPGVHNSYWVKSPNLRDMANPDLESTFLAYVYDVVHTFRNDPRIYAWDIWNEPDNTDDRRAEHGMCSRDDVVAYLLPKFFQAARSAKPTQPLTSGVWKDNQNWHDVTKTNAVQRIQLTESDIISFHCYGDSASFEFCVAQLKKYGRPMLCTEYLARSIGSTFEKILPLGKKYNIAMINWGLVQGKTQTHFPWDSWQEPYTKRVLPIWHHEVFQQDGKPYREAETKFIREMTAKRQ